MEEMFNVRNTTTHPVHLTYRDEKKRPVHVTLKPGAVGALPRVSMLTAVLNPLAEHKGEVVAADTVCKAEVDKMLPAIKTVKEAATPLAKEPVAPGLMKGKGNKPGREP